MVNKMKGAAIAAMLFALAACGGKEAEVPAVAQAAAAPLPVATSADGATAAEQYLIKQGVNISQAFVSRSNLKAVVADNGSERRLFYITPDGQSLISGMVFDTSGQNITSEDMARFNVRDVGGSQVLTPTQLGDLWERAGKLSYIAEGKGRPVYVVFDPNCPYCHRLWGMLRQTAAEGKVQIRWIPVAILSESSKNLAAAMYQTKDQQQALNDFGAGMLAPVDTIDKATADVLARNLLLLRDTGYTGVPTLLWKEGDQVRVKMEVPDDVLFKTIFN